jgi:ATP phosphoribosyltransferase regulatory subunit
VARIDAHLLNRRGVARLSYCGPVVHTRIDRPLASREPLQFGAEIYGHAGLEADLEVLELAQACLSAAGVRGMQIDLADVRVIDAVLAPAALDTARIQRIHAALAIKDAAALEALSVDLPERVRQDLLTLPGLFGGVEVLEQARAQLQPSPLLHTALDSLNWLVAQLGAVPLSIDLADLRGYAYYTGMRFAIFAPGRAGEPEELARGGRYDEVGAVFGRKRPAVGFSLDLKELVGAVKSPALRAAVRAPWGVDASLREAIASLRTQGHTVVCALPGHEQEIDEFCCDRALEQEPHGGWTVKPL